MTQRVDVLTLPWQWQIRPLAANGSRHMNMWMIAAACLLVALVPCGYGCFRGGAVERLIALELAGTVVTLVLLLLAQGYGRAIYFDVPLTLALLSFGGSLAFARFLERWL